MTDRLRIDRARFLQSITEVAQIGLLPDAEGVGRDRRPFSAADRAARAYLRREAEAARLSVALDGAANLWATLDCGDTQAQTLLLGSHLDTVPHGGAFDGALGVLAGLEVLRTLRERNVPLRHHVAVVDFTDEEGRFGDFFGSRAVAGRIDGETIQSFLTKAGAYPEDLAAMRTEVPGGLTAESIEQARREPSSLAGYLEIHIEQGPCLERAGVPIGIVTAIFGRRSWRITFHGRSDHAGTTPLSLRQDALLAAARYIAAAPERVHAQVPDAVVTCGDVTVQPGVYNVVPNTVTVLTEFRAATEGALDDVERILLALAAEASDQSETSHTIEHTARSHPTPMDNTLQRTLRQAARACGYATLDLPSGAGHDAQMLATVTPAGMIFVPSHQGRSHSPAEQTEPDDLVAGANVLLHAALALAAQ